MPQVSGVKCLESIVEYLPFLLIAPILCKYYSTESVKAYGIDSWQNPT